MTKSYPHCRFFKVVYGRRQWKTSKNGSLICFLVNNLLFVYALYSFKVLGLNSADRPRDRPYNVDPVFSRNYLRTQLGCGYEKLRTQAGYN